MKKTIFILLALMSTLMAAAQTVAGSWTGKLAVGGTQLTLVFNITDKGNGGYACTLDSPDQGVKGLPADITVSEGTKVKISLAQLMASYEGELKDGIMKGTFTQGGMSFTLDMKPGTAEVNRPQTPKPPYPYTTEEVTFTSAAGNATLSGTLTCPVGYADMQKEDVPVVVMVTGSGLQNRDEEVFGHKPFLVLADYLARNGIATLRYDDRGTGKSTGSTADMTTETNMTDALAAADFVRSTGKFGPVGVLGHSEGGAIAFMLGARGKADFVISMAGQGVSGDSILISQNRVTMQQAGVPENVTAAYCAALKSVLASIAGGTVGQDPEETVAAAVRSAGGNLPPGASANLVKVIQTASPWMKYFIAYDPSADIKAVKCPVMAVNGEKDVQVIAAENLPAIQRLLPADSLNMVKEYAGLNHLFQHCTTGAVTEYRQIEETMSPEVMQDIAAWIHKVN